MQRRLAAILAADVVGYSRLMADDDAGTYESVRAVLSDVVTPAVQRHDGEIFKTTGDGFLAAFGSTVQALEAAIAIQEGFAARPLDLRIGLNLGDVIVADGDLFGDGVNIAARLESMAEPGAIYVSAPVVRSIGKMPGVEFMRLGPRRAKNMAEPIEVYAARWGGRCAPTRLAAPASGLDRRGRCHGHHPWGWHPVDASRYRGRGGRHRGWHGRQRPGASRF